MREERGGAAKSIDDRIIEASMRIVEEGRARMQGANVIIYNETYSSKDEPNIRKAWVNYWLDQGCSQEEAELLSTAIGVMPPGSTSL